MCILEEFGSDAAGRDRHPASTLPGSHGRIFAHWYRAGRCAPQKHQSRTHGDQMFQFPLPAANWRAVAPVIISTLYDNIDNIDK